MTNKHVIPIRLIVTTNCNGNCYYCHNEGTSLKQDMTLDMIASCADIAKQISAPIAITGGEPTLRKDLDSIIYEIYNIYPHINQGLTTNGAQLLSFSDLKICINTLNLSITSFDNNIAQKYQNVNPQTALKGFEQFPANNKNLNIVVVKDNYLEIPKFIDYCIKNKYNLDLMFELKSYTKEDIAIQKYVLGIVERLGRIELVLKQSPILEICVNSYTKIHIKHPYLSSLPRFEFCKNCSKAHNCFERICSLRIFPDGNISPCLYRKFSIDINNFTPEIIKIYQKVNDDVSYLSFITET